MKKRLNRNGFTLIELIMVIVILGVLAVVALPRFFNLRTNALDAAEQGVVGGVRAGIATTVANNAAQSISPLRPADLDGITVPAACGNGTAACFDDVLDQGGITDSTWAKTTDTATTDTYTHTGNNNSVYTYDPANGSFLCTSTCP